MEHQVPQSTCSLDLRDSIEELLRFTLQSSIDKTLEFDLGLSRIFCSNLLSEDPENPISLPSSFDSLYGVPPYPLYKRLASVLHKSIVSGVLFRAHSDLGFINEDVSLKQKETEWKLLILDKGSQLIDIMKTTFCELHLPEPFFAQMKDGRKTVDGRPAVDNYDRIRPDSLILLNKCVLLQVQYVKTYDSFPMMLEAEGVEKVFPEVETVEEGLQIFREVYMEEDERINGVVAICVSKVTAQPYIILASILSGLSYDGIQSFLGLAHTVGTILEALPPPRSALVSSFKLPYNPNVKGSTLSHGARALTKHANRSSNKNWGSCEGSDSNKNRLAVEVICDLIASCCWLNVHIVPPHGAVFEIRGFDGYGARWSKDGNKFIGFLEPYMEDGHKKGWKH